MSRINYLADAALAIVFAINISAIALKEIAIHKAAGKLFIILVGVHLFLHRKIIFAMMKNTMKGIFGSVTRV